MDASDRLGKRLTDLELLFTHLERQVADLHEVVLRQQQRIEQAEKQIVLLGRGMENESGEPDAPDN
jgi:uncharacterized coiled-coil protein SlyX